MNELMNELINEQTDLAYFSYCIHFWPKHIFVV